MPRFSLRRSVLRAVAGVLSRWLSVVTAGLEPESPPPPAAPRQPPPPEHWLELVRERAPQLLDSESPAGDSALVIDWHADESAVEDAPPVLPAPPHIQTRPLQLHPAQHRQPSRVDERTTAPAANRRPLRLERVAVEALDAAGIAVHSTGSGTSPSVVHTTERLVPTTVPVHDTGTPERDALAAEDRSSTALPEAAAVLEVQTTVPAVKHPRRRLFRIRLPALKRTLRRREAPDASEPAVVLPVSAERPYEAALHEIPTVPAPAAHLSPHFSGALFEHQHIRETRASLPEQPRLTSVATRAGERIAPRQQPTSVPGAPPQWVMRPAHPYPPLAIEDITPDRWASLPESPADQPSEPGASRYDRLRREQEGRTWSE